MKFEFDEGYAFILEGETEKQFYLVFLEYLSNKHGLDMERFVETSTPGVSYLIRTSKGVKLLKFNVVSTVTQMPRAGRWFESQCVSNYKGKHNWYVFLCYDRDSYKADISKFYEGDWAILRNDLKQASEVVDMAAAADIEDILLIDIENICKYLDCAIPSELKGSKGETKIVNSTQFDPSARSFRPTFTMN